MNGRDPDDALSVVLVGVTGDGKSSTGNTLVGRPAFRVSSGLCSETAACEHADYVHEQCGPIRVIDTIGLHDTGLPASEVLARFSRFADHTPSGISLFLFVVRWGRFKPEHDAALDAFVANCGEDALGHTILVFTSCELGPDELRAALAEHAPASLRALQPRLRAVVGVDNVSGGAVARERLHDALHSGVGVARYSNAALAEARVRHDVRQEEERAAFAAAVSDWRKGSGPVIIERECEAKRT